jgi:hypothetical protein
MWSAAAHILDTTEELQDAGGRGGARRTASNGFGGRIWEEKRGEASEGEGEGVTEETRGVGEEVLIPSPVGGWPRCRRSAGRRRRSHARADTASDREGEG